MDELGERYPDAVLSLVAPDGFPFSVRVPISVDRGRGAVRIGGDVLGRDRSSPASRASLRTTTHPEFSWQRNFQVRGDLVEEDGGWVLVPHKHGRRPRAAAGVEAAGSTRRTPARWSGIWRTAKKTRRGLGA